MGKAACRFLIFSLTVAALAAQGDFRKGVSYYKQRQYSKAIAEFEQILETNPDYEDGYRILGHCYLKTKDYPKAAQAFRSALRLRTDIYASYYGLALAYYNSGQYPEAIATLLKGERMARSPLQRYQLYHTRGTAYYNLRDFENAVANLKKAISIKRGNATDVLQIGIAYYQLGHDSEAENYLKQALTLDSNAEQAQRYLSQIRHRKATKAIKAGNYKEAVAILSGHLTRNDQDGEAWFNLGLAYLFSDDLEASEKAFQKASQLMPDNGQAYDRLGYIYEKTRRYQEALQHYRKAHDLTQDEEVKASVERIQKRIRRMNEQTSKRTNEQTRGKWKSVF